MKRSADVVVVGAGPVGLMLAIELRRRGVDLVLLERRSDPSLFVKALGITPRTLEIWDQVGLLEPMLAAGLFLGGTTTLRNGVEIDSQDLPREGLGYGFLTIAQYEVERVLREAFLQSGGTIDWDTALIALDDRGDAVVATVRRGGREGAEERLECRYLVGCDGAHSTVRHALGLAYEGEAVPMTFMLGDVYIDGPLARDRIYRALHFEGDEMVDQVVAIAIPGNPRRYRVSMVAPLPLWAEDADLTTPPTLEQIAAAATPALPPGVTFSELRWSSFYRISHRIVPRYSVGRCFLAGDAAHIHPPIGGQGMNTGLQDAFNLAWKLALAVRGRAAADLLESYDEERRPVGRAVVERTSQRMERAIQGVDRGESDEQARADSQLLIGYRESRWVSGDAGLDPSAPRPGDRLPQAGGLARACIDFPARLLDLLRHPHHTLLCHVDGDSAEADSARFADLADRVRERFGEAVVCYGIAGPAARTRALERVSWLVDARGEVARALRPRPGGLDLVRPDGHLAHRSNDGDGEALASALERVLRPVSRA